MSYPNVILCKIIVFWIVNGCRIFTFLYYIYVGIKLLCFSELFSELSVAIQLTILI